MVTATDVVPGRYFQIGDPIKGILKVSFVDFPMYGDVSIKGEYLDLKTGGIVEKKFSSIYDLTRGMSSVEVMKRTANVAKRLQQWRSK